MPDDRYKITSREWDDAELQRDGSVKHVTRVRFFVGEHGPFERTFDRGTDTRTIERAMTEKRDELQRRDAL